MSKTTIKILTLFFALCLAFGILPAYAYAASPAEEEVSVAQSMTLGADLTLHLWVKLPEEYEARADSVTATLTYSKRTETESFRNLEKKEQGYHLPVELAMGEMTENINLVINDGSTEIFNNDYSIRNYLTALLEGDYDQMTKDLCLELLNYGAWAQKYFEHNLDDLATDENISVANPVPAESPAVERTGAVEGISLYGTTVRFLSNAAVRFYFTADNGLDGYTFTVDGTRYTPVAKGGLYYIEIPGINPQDMGTEISVQVTDGKDTFTVQYAPIWYFIRTYHKSADTTTKGLMEAAYSYYKEAEVYTTKICMDVDISTLGNNHETIDIGFYPYGFAGDINDPVDTVTVKTGEVQTVKLDRFKYLVDGDIPGISFAILGGPTWNETTADGNRDVHNITISNIRLEGEEDRLIDMSSATVKTGFNNSTSFGLSSLVDGKVVIKGGSRNDGHRIIFDKEMEYETTEPEATEPESTEPQETEPPVTGDSNTEILVDMLLTTLGNSTESINVRFYRYDYTGSVHNSFTDEVAVTAGTETTIRLDLDDYLVDGKLTGIGFAIMGGPEWNTQLTDGTYDRHTVTITGVYLEGEQNKAYDLSQSVWAGGTNGTGYTDANGSGAATIGQSIVITNGFRYDGHKISLVEDTNTYLCMDLLLTTLSNSADAVNIRLYNYNYTASVGDEVGYIDQISVTAGTTAAIKVKVDGFLVDGELPGVGFAIMGGPEWNTPLDGGGYDRHSVVISNVRLEGYQSKAYDLSKSVCTSGTNGTGYTWANGSGVASIVDGELVITNGYRYDGHKITLEEDTNTYICLDMQIDTLGGNWTEDIEVGFGNGNFTGDIESLPERVTVTAGTKSTIKLNVADYLVDGKLNGISFVIFGGPEYNTELADGTYDRHSVTISSIRLEGAQEKAFDLSASTITSGKNAGFTNANGAGRATVIDGAIVIEDGFRYDGHKLSLVEESNTYLCMDLLFTTLGGSDEPTEMRFYSHNYADNVHNVYTDLAFITPGNKVTVRLDVDKYLVDGKLPGFGIAIFGGPEWEDKLPDGYTSDRHTLVISNVWLEGEENRSIDLNSATITVGLNGSNGGGTPAISNGEIVITDGYCYDGYKIAF